MLSSIKKTFSSGLGNNANSNLGGLSVHNVIKFDSFGFAEFPSPDDVSKQLLPILKDPEEELNRLTELSAESTQIESEKPGPDNKDYWMPDKICKVCYACEDPFSMFRRRHHCRMCGQVFCNQCSSYYMEGSLIKMSGLVRCCKLCFDQVERETKVSVKRRQTNSVESSTSATLAHSIDNEISAKPTSFESSVMANRRGVRHQDFTNRSTFIESPSAKLEFSNILQNRASAHLEAVMKLLIQESSIKENTEFWESVIISLIREVVSSVDPNVKEGDSIDIRNYVKLKIIPGGTMTESVFIDGIVFKKNVAHKKMMREKNESNPRILLLSGGIDFQRMDSKLSSMDTLIDQEDKYIEILIEKIMTLKPDLILVGKSVARRAQELFCNHKVVVMQNVKQTILSRISRLTGAKILLSTDHMFQPAGENCLGTCGNFSLRIIQDDPEKMDQQVGQRVLRTRIARGTTYAYIEGCPSEKGCTIVLRGASREVLNEVKRLLNFGILVAYHLRLEVAYYTDRCAIIPSKGVNNGEVDDDSDDDIMDVTEDKLAADDEKKLKVCELKDRERRFLLSMSLDVDFSLPYSSEIRGVYKFKGINPNVIKTLPQDHQTLVVSTILMNDTSQRSKSEIRGFKYYTSQDLSLGQFLVDNCFNVARNISRDNSMLDQTLTFIHRPGRIEISVFQLNSTVTLDENVAASQTLKGNSIPIYMSSYCKECGVLVTPETLISDETWKLSFGKFLELLFYNRSAKCRLGKCTHHIRDDHVLIFTSEFYAAKFNFVPIHPYSLYVRHLMSFQPTFHMQQAYKLLSFLPQQYVTVVENFRGNLYALVNEAKEVFLNRTSSDDFLSLLADINNMETELVTAVNTLTKSVAVTISSLPSSILESSILLEDATINEIISGPIPPTSQSKSAVEALLNADDNITFEKLTGPDHLDHNNAKQKRKHSFYEKDPLGRVSDDSSLDIKLKYPMYYRRQVYQQLHSWNVKLRAIGKWLETVKENFLQQQNSQHISSASPPSAYQSNSFMSSISGIDVPIVDNHEAKPEKQLKVIYENHNEDFTTSTSLEGSSNPTRDVSSNDELTVPIASPVVQEPQFTSPVTVAFESNPSVSFADISMSSLEGLNIPHIKSEKNQSKTARFALTRTLARIVMGKDTVEEAERKFEVNLGELGKGRYSLPPGRKGEVIHIIDNEPGTIIAYSLASSDYHDDFEEFMAEDYEDLDSDEDFGFVPDDPSTAVNEGDKKEGLEDGFENDEDVEEEEDDDDGENDIDDETSSKVKAVPIDFERPVIIDPTQPLPKIKEPLMLSPRERRKAKSKKSATAVSEALAKAKSSNTTEEGDLQFTTFQPSENIFINRSEPASNRYISKDDDLSEPQDSSVYRLTSLHTDDSEGFHSDPNTKSVPQNSSKLDENRRYLLEKQMLSQRKSHIKHKFEDCDDKGTVICKFQCQSYWATQFDAVRATYLGDTDNEHYIRSLSMSQSWLAKGGRSGATFSKSIDDRFVIKVINKVEMQMFLDFAPAYFEYMVKAFFHNLPTVLCKIMGVYTVGFHNRETGEKVLQNIVIMENMFYQRNITGVFDLKGSSRARYLNIPGEKPLSFDDVVIKRRRAKRQGTPVNSRRFPSSQVMLDDNLMELTKGRPFPLKQRAKVYFTKAVTNDTLFLRMIDVVDYSILVGFDEDSHEIVVGIIDYLRKYDIVKKMERMGKSVGMLTGQAEPTIIQPLQYRNRFQQAMERYFMTVPDKWIAYDQ